MSFVIYDSDMLQNPNQFKLPKTKKKNKKKKKEHEDQDVHLTI